MSHTAAVSIVAGDIVLRIDPEREGISRPWCIDGRKATAAQEKPMSAPAAVKIITYDLALWVICDREGVSSARDIDGSEAAIAQ